METSLIGIMAWKHQSQRAVQVAHRCGTDLANDLFLEVECSADYRNGVGVDISTVLSGGGARGNKILHPRYQGGSAYVDID